MSTRQHAIRYDPNGLPLRGPEWSVYSFIFGLLALLTFIAVIYGFVHAAAF
jgi:hypothetical protein